MTKIEAGEGNDELQKENLDSQKWEQPKTYSEDDYKNLQSFSTKAQQEKISLAEKLVKNSPKELEGMDVKLQNKVIENLYWASSLEELKIISPELFEENNKRKDDDEDETVKLEKKVRLMEYKMNQWAVSTAIENMKISNKDLADTIPEFENRMKEEMKTFSSDLSVKEKAEKAFTLVAWKWTWAEAYLAMQGATTIKSSGAEKDEKGDIENSPLANAFKKSFRKA